MVVAGAVVSHDRTIVPEPGSQVCDLGEAAEMAGMLIDVPGGHLNAVIEGEGPTVLLLHGFPEGAWAWRHQLPAAHTGWYKADSESATLCSGSMTLGGSLLQTCGVRSK